MFLSRYKLKAKRYAQFLKRTTLRHLTFILIGFTLFGCDANTQSNNQTTSQDNIKLVPSYENLDIDEISEPCAVIISPTDTKINRLKKDNGDDFYTVADDNLFYIGSARQLLDSLKTKTIDTEATGQLTFKQKDGAYTSIDLSEFYWGIILFNGKDAPIEADITTFVSEYKRYMNY